MKKEYLPKVLKEVFKQRLQRNFRQLKFGSLTYHRDRQNYRTVKIVQLVNRIHNKILLNKTQAFNKICSKA